VCQKLQKLAKFDKSGCKILNQGNKVIVVATKLGNLYYLRHCKKGEVLMQLKKPMKYCSIEGIDRHVGEQKLKSLANGKPVEYFDYDSSRELGFCESCISGKQHRSPIDSSERQTEDLLELVNSNVCGKISDKSIGGAQYFLTFTDDKSRHTWVYIIKTKDQVFQCFLEWKAFVEKASK